jgi:DNA-binding MarR family transcriptional regulator
MSSNISNDHPEPAGFDEAMRSFVARTVLFQQAVAQRLNLTASDLQCLTILQTQGPKTVGQLAEHTGLTSGAAITGAVDRLERAGYVSRTADPTDRRRVVIQPHQDRIDNAITPLYASIARRTLEELAGHSAEELALIAGFLARAGALTYEATRELRNGRARK